MRIAIILSSFPEISEKFLLNHVVGAVEAGQDITVFSAHEPKSSMRHELFDQWQLSERVRCLYIPRSVKERFLAAPRLFLSLLFRNPRAALEALNILRYRSAAKNGKLLYFGSLFSRMEPFDLVHCHFGPNGLIGAYLKSCRFCSRLVTTFHGSDINSYPRRHGQSVYRYLYKTADRLTANTSFTRSKLVANGASEEKIAIVPVGLVVSDYQDIQRSHIEPFSLLTVGRLEEKKGHRYALEAVALLRKRFPSIRYTIAGGGSLRASLEARAKKLGITDCVSFLGVVTGDQVRQLYESTAVFTLPSVTASNGDMEGQGLVIQEAQICMIPVVTTRHNGIPDGLLEDKSGFLVPEKDAEALAEKIAYLFEHPDEGQKMGQAGRTFVLNNYDVRTLTEQLGQLYASLF